MTVQLLIWQPVKKPFVLESTWERMSVFSSVEKAFLFFGSLIVMIDHNQK
jgi:hypothetical protein